MLPRRGHRARQVAEADAYWAQEIDSLCARLGTSREGLSQHEAADRLAKGGPNQLDGRPVASRIALIARQLRSPLLLILAVAAVASALSGEWVDATLVLAIIIASTGIGYSREYSAQTAVAALQSRVRTHATVARDGSTMRVPVEALAPGDVVLLSAGTLVPGDGIVLEATDFYVNEAVLTGESYPVEKRPGAVPPSAAVRERFNSIFFGTNVQSGSARCLIVRTGAATEFGAIAARLMLRPPETEFEAGIRRFGYLLGSMMLVLVLVVFAALMLRARPPIETLLFSVALAVGLSPELLPAILSVNLARAAGLMARHGVIVRRLTAIENLGSMDVLCTDKTGTLTEGVVELGDGYDPFGTPSPRVLTLAWVNAALASGFNNALDDAIMTAERCDKCEARKLAEIPFDFVRKRVSVIVDQNGIIELITKGAFAQVLETCTTWDSGRVLDAAARAQLNERHAHWAGQGIRVLAVGTRRLSREPSYTRGDEAALDFAGFVTFLDRPKVGVAETLGDLATLGVAVKIITGDSRLVAQHLASLVGLPTERVLTGRELLALRDEAMWHAAERTDLFVEVDPNQKERIILALKKLGHVVGFLGDGVNDVPAMHAADASVSVERAVDVAREAADFVLLERDLDIIRRGIEEGRRTFANTLKYVVITTSANLGNMVSMAAASLFLPFLPLTAGQILLNNFLSDIPAIGLADDAVDPELVARPERWHMASIGRFMVLFGLLSSLFDIMTFWVLIGVFATPPALFRTGWFVESLLTELAVALILRTRRPLGRSRPSRLLVGLTVFVAALAVLLPFAPFAGSLGFVPLPPPVLATVVAIAACYVLASETAKRWYFPANGAEFSTLPPKRLDTSPTSTVST